MQKFYNREDELQKLRHISSNIQSTKGQLSVMVGRRRVGKTRLLQEAFYNAKDAGYETIPPFLYLFISRKSETALVEEFAAIIKNQLHIKFFTPKTLLDVFEFLFDYTKKQPLTLVIDEFQDIERINNSVFSGLQHLWDTYKRDSMIHWICCGSLYSLMTRLFKGSKQPLLNRDDHFFKLQPLSPIYIQEMLHDSQLYTPERMLIWWCLSGGIPKYLEWLVSAGQHTFDELIQSSSPLIEEGMHRLIEDFGTEHASYFSVLEAIALGYTSRPRIEDYVGVGVGPLLDKLETEFGTIAKIRPIHAKTNSRDVRYQLVDPFLNFWFTFIHANRSTVEMGNFQYINALIDRDFATFSGKQLEGLYTQLLKDSQQFNRIGGYWDQKGEHEIDIVAINDMEKLILVVEVKRQLKRFNESTLQQKTKHLLQKLGCADYTVEQACFSLDNMEQVFATYIQDPNKT